MRTLGCGLFCAAALCLFAAPASAAPPQAPAEAIVIDEGPPYLFEHSCKTGKSVSIMTPDIKVQEAFQKLFDGKMTPYEFLDFMRTNAKPANASREEAAALRMLSTCMEINIQRI